MRMFVFHKLPFRYCLGYRDIRVQLNRKATKLVRVRLKCIH